MKLFRAITRVLLFIPILYFGGNACRKESPEGLGSQTAEDPTKHFELTPQSVVLREGSKAVKEISPDHSVFVLDGAASGVNELSAGKVMLIPGVDAGKITKVRKKGSDVEVEMGPVKITDVIRNGVLQWKPTPAKFSDSFLLVEKNPQARNVSWKMVPETPFKSFGDFFVEPAYADSTKQVGMTVGDYSVVFKFDNDTWQLNATKSKGVKVTISVKVKWIKLVTKGRIDVGYGTVTGYDFDAPMTGYIELDVSSTSEEAKAFPPQVVIELPFEQIIPVPIYGIPFYVGLKLNFLIQPSLSTTNSGISLHLRSDFDGNACVVYKDGAIDRCSEIKWEKPEDPLSKVNAVPSPGHTAIVFAVQCPRISAGIGTQAIARGGAYVDMVTSMGVTVFGATSILPCRQLTLTRTLGAGLEFELGPDLFKKLLENLSKKTKLRMENKIELAREDLHWHAPPVKGCE